MYIPDPIDTSDIELPEELVELQELIAKNTHEIWSKGRIEEGWTLGPVKDSSKKETPLLVPYEELSELEKDYDRNTSIGAIKLILKLGYKITKE